MLILNSIRAAVECPALFNSLIVVEPAMINGKGKVADFSYLRPIVGNAVSRPDGWPSRCVS